MRVDLVRRAQHFLLLIIGVGLATGFFSGWQSARSGSGLGWLNKLAGPPQTLAGQHIGIISGHMGYDTGTVCADGLTEASVNRGIADLVVGGLKRRGAEVDLLNEYDDRLWGYQADAFVSIHADSCQTDFSGFKVASLTGGSAASSRLEQCIWGGYEKATNLPRHTSTITDNMREYHAFHQVDPGTPAAIIETGFLSTDRRLLTGQRDLAAAGIVAGIECFLAPKPAATAAP